MSGTCQVINVTRRVLQPLNCATLPKYAFFSSNLAVTFCPSISSAFHNPCNGTALLKYIMNYTYCLDIIYCYNSLQARVQKSRLCFLGSIHQLSHVLHAFNKTSTLFVETSELRALLQNINNDNRSGG